MSKQQIRPKELAKLIKPYVDVTWTHSIGSGAVGRYFNRDRAQLDEYFVMTKTASTHEAGYLWQIVPREVNGASEVPRVQVEDRGHGLAEEAAWDALDADDEVFDFTPAWVALLCADLLPVQQGSQLRR